MSGAQQEQMILCGLGLAATCFLAFIHANDLAMMIGGGLLGYMTPRPATATTTDKKEGA